MNTREQRLRELVAKLRESANENWSTSQDQDLPEWVRDRANGVCSGKRYAASELEAILAEPVEVSEEAAERAYDVFMAIRHGETYQARMKKAITAAIKEPGQ